MLQIRTILITMSLLAGISLTSCDNEEEMPIAVIKPNLDFYILRDGNQIKKN